MNHYNKKKYFIQLGIQVFYLWDFMGMEFIKKFIIDVLNNKEPSIKPYDDSIDLMRVSIEDYDNIVPSDEEPIYINDRLFTISKAGKFKEV